MRSMGNGKIMVEFFSVDISINVCRYLNCKDIGFWDRISDASESFVAA